MNPTIKNIKSLASQHKVLRGVNPFTLNVETINKICDICIDEVQSSIVSKSGIDWNCSWKSQSILTKAELEQNYKPIPRLDRLIQTITENLQRSFPIKVSMTKKLGPEYVYFCSGEKSNNDWVHVPHLNRFSSNKIYYKIFVHELGHAACSRNRLCLKFGMMDEEEVTVDSVAMILCFLMGINVWEDSIAYSQNRSYGEKKKKKKDHILYVKTAKQWRTIKNKTKRIVKYFLSGREKPTGLISL